MTARSRRDLLSGIVLGAGALALTGCARAGTSHLSAASTAEHVPGLIPEVPTFEAGMSDLPASTPASSNLIRIGLYTWQEMALLPAAKVQWLGIHLARLGGIPNDMEMEFFSRSGIDVMCTTNNGKRTPNTTDDAFIEAYLASVATTMSAYGPGGSYWTANPTVKPNPIKTLEIFNEPNFDSSLGSTIPEKATLYAKVLVAAYDYVKAKWPGVTVVGFSAGGVSAAAPPWVDAVLTALEALGRLDAFDVVSIHPYATFGVGPELTIKEAWGSWTVQENMQTCVDLVAQRRISVPVWISEIGYAIQNTDGGTYTNPVNGYMGQDYSVSPTLQAAYSVRLVLAAVRAGIPRVYFMNVVDTDDTNMGWFAISSAEISSGNGTPNPRPVAAAMRFFNMMTAEATSMIILLDGSESAENSPFAYQLATPKGNVIIAWNQGGSTTSIPVDPASALTVTDMTGRKITTLAPGTTSYSATLSASPVYIFADRN